MLRLLTPARLSSCSLSYRVRTEDPLQSGPEPLPVKKLKPAISCLFIHCLGDVRFLRPESSLLISDRVDCDCTNHSKIAFSALSEEGDSLQQPIRDIAAHFAHRPSLRLVDEACLAYEEVQPHVQAVQDA